MDIDQRFNRVGLYTLGCKVSQYETEAVAERFSSHGFAVCDFSDVCDFYVVNTCTVTAESDRKCRQLIRRAAKTNPECIILVMGCYSQRASARIAELPRVFGVVGTENKLSLVEIAENMRADILSGRVPTQYVSVTDLENATFEPMCIRHAPRTRAYVKIEDGCDCRCTYCAIAPARGSVRSKLPSDVIDEVLGLYKNGTREIVLTGIEIGSYGKDFADGYGLAELLSELDADGCAERIRLGSLAPELVTREFVDKIAGLKVLAPHFHLSLQSGSDSVLARMRRRYNSAMAMAVVDYIREKIPRATFTADLMVGFVGEGEDDFDRTVDFVRRARLLDAHVFAYSRREGTPAALYEGQVDEKTKRARSEKLIKVKNEVRDSVLDEIVACGAPLSVIAENEDGAGYYTAHSDTYVEVKFKSARSNLSGEMVDVVPVSHKNGVVYAKLINEI